MCVEQPGEAYTETGIPGDTAQLMTHSAIPSKGSGDGHGTLARGEVDVEADRRDNLLKQSGLTT